MMPPSWARETDVRMVQMIGATTPLFTAVLSLIIVRTHEGWLVYGSLVPVVVGEPC